jgi:hypothetical protein
MLIGRPLKSRRPDYAYIHLALILGLIRSLCRKILPMLRFFPGPAPDGLKLVSFVSLYVYGKEIKDVLEVRLPWPH